MRMSRLEALSPSSPWRSVDSLTVSRACSSIVCASVYEGSFLLAVVALGDQLRFGAEHVVEAIIRVLDRARAAADAELLRGHAFDAGAFARAADLDGDVVQLGPR